MKKIVLLVLVLVLFSKAIVWGFIRPSVTYTNESISSYGDGKFVFVSSNTIWVPDNFTTIQEAINNASYGDTIFVRAGTYYEHVTINKSVALIGENKYNTVIDGNGTGSVVYITANNVKFTCFTIQNSGSTYPDSGIYLECSSGNNITDNITTKNKFGIFVRYSSNNALTGNIVSNNLHGIELMYSSENVLINNNASSNNAGVLLYGAHNNILTDNTVTNNNGGVVISHSGNNIICNNVFSDNEWAGIRVLDQSSGNLLFDNTASSNLDGFELTYVNDNTLVNNIASYNRRYGIQVAYSNINVLISNEVSNNIYGIRVSESSSNNTIYHNNFINNTWQAYILPSPLNTMWDDGYPSGGNYWSDHTGVDNFSGPFQNEIGSDGIRDTPRIIDESNRDRYPLMNPWSLLPVHNINTGFGYATIQEAIDASETLDGHTIFVEAGIYYEHVVVNKEVSLIGENKYNTIIDGNGTGTVIDITANDITISDFTIRNSAKPGHHGIHVYRSNGNNISHNIITNNGYGIYIYWSSNNIIAGNIVSKNWIGISLSNYFYFILTNNTISNNERGITLYAWMGVLPRIFHNNFINNGIQGYAVVAYALWDDGYPSGGNYWSDYTGVDIKSGSNQDQPGSDGIGDTPYVFDDYNQDNYPLMYPWGSPPPPSYTLTIYSSPTGVKFTVDCISRTTPWSGTYNEGTSVSLEMPKTHTVGEARYYWNQWSDGNTSRSRTVTMNTSITLTAHYTGPYYPLTFNFTYGKEMYSITTLSNSTITSFNFSQTLKQISFNVTGADDTLGFCNLTISNSLIQDLWLGNFTVLVDGKEPIMMNNWTDVTYTYIYFTYQHSEHKVEIISEFTTWTSMLVILTMLTVAIAIYKRRLFKTPIH